MQSPLVSLVVIAYKQERYIREAVEGAFSQSYSPLEIVLSDDASPDQTFNIMTEMAAAYDGPHRIRLNRNPQTLGLVKHLNQLVELSKGDLIVCAAGDDISESERCSEIVKKFSDHPSAHSVHSYMSAFNDKESSTKICGSPFEFVRGDSWIEDLCGVIRKRKYLMGASHAFRRDCYTKFGPISDRVTNEDSILMLRSCMLGGVAFIDKPLVRYRQHENNITGYNLSLIKQRVRFARFSLTTCMEWKKEIGETEWIPLAGKEALAKTIDARMSQDKMSIEVLESEHPALSSIKWLLRPSSNKKELLRLVRWIFRQKCSQQ